MALYIDEKFKDASPVETVNKIKGILDDLGFEVIERWNDSGVEMCKSMRITVKGTGLGSNGKGVSEELARASAYAEFMERLQSGFMGLHLVEPIVYNDSVLLTKEELLENCKDILSASAKTLAKFSPKSFTPERLADKLMELDGNTGTIEAAPFYNPLKEEVCYVPICLVRSVCGSNGLAAGNSVEEALVQGFSEIIERYARTRIAIEKLTPPTIPEEYIKQCPVAYKIITQVRAAGYDVIIKDCSLGEGFPVVAVVYLDKVNHTYHVHMGASPVFEIALERSLTESFQGTNLKKVTRIDSVLNNKQENFDVITLKDAFVHGRVPYHAELFGSTPSWEFVPFEDKSACTNHELFKGVLEYVKRNGYQIYIRDMSFLGFNTFRIYVPGITEVLYAGITSEIPAVAMENSLKKCMRDIGNATVDELFTLQMFFKYKQIKEKEKKFSRISRMPMNKADSFNEFLLQISSAYISWQLGNTAEALKYAHNAEKYTWQTEDADFLSCLRRYYEFRANKYEEDETLDIISNFYSADIVSKVKTVVTTKVNPYSRFLLVCTEGNCENCQYGQFCYIMKYKEIMSKLNAAARAYDHKASFENMRNLFSAE